MAPYVCLCRSGRTCFKPSLHDQVYVRLQVSFVLRSLAVNGSSLHRATASLLCSRIQIRREMFPLSAGSYFRMKENGLCFS